MTYLTTETNNLHQKKSEIEDQTMVDDKLQEAKNKLLHITQPDSNTSNMMLQLTKSIDDAMTQVAEQKNWLKLYFSKGKSGRKSMFLSGR